jgi:hypothetical protein
MPMHLHELQEESGFLTTTWIIPDEELADYGILPVIDKLKWTYSGVHMHGMGHLQIKIGRA